jgi:hypothetical protein
LGFLIFVGLIEAAITIAGPLVSFGCCHRHFLFFPRKEDEDLVKKSKSSVDDDEPSEPSEVCNLPVTAEASKSKSKELKEGECSFLSFLPLWFLGAFLRGRHSEESIVSELWWIIVA